MFFSPDRLIVSKDTDKVLYKEKLVAKNIKGIMTRYAKKMVNNRYFGLINVNGLQTFSLDTLR